VKTTPFNVGAYIQWKWVDGKVEEIFMGPIEKEIKGKNIKRNGPVERPAYLVRSDSGNLGNYLAESHLELSSAPSFGQLFQVNT
jgi:hypothetical protein